MQCKTLLFGFLIFFLSVSILCFVVPQLSVSAAGWNNVETWTGTFSGTGSWHSVETLTLQGQSSGYWRKIETWTLTFESNASWHDSEYWSFSGYSHTEAWHDAEIWTLAFDTYGTWCDVEGWNVTGQTTNLGFHEIETWNFTGSALKQIIAWNPLIKFSLPGYGTYVGFDDTVYFDSFAWSIDNKSITFTNIYMDSGTPIPSLTVAMIGGNVSFSTIDYLYDVSFMFYASRGTTVTLYLAGLDVTPYTVTFDGTPIPVGSGWSWDGSTLIVTFAMPSDTTRIVLSWMEITTFWHDVETWNSELNPPSVIISGVTWYYRSNTITANSISGYELSSTMDNTFSSCTQNLGVSSDPVQFGFLVYMVNSHNESASLLGATPTPIIIRTEVGEGYQSESITVPTTRLTLGLDTVEVELYIRLSSGSWLLSARFTTQRLMYKALVESSWQFTLYTKTELDVSNNVLASAYWGDSTHQSGIAGISLELPTPQEISIYYAGRGDWVHAILYPYMIYAGEGVYGLGFLFVGGVLYLRHKKWEVILVCLFMFGGAGGVGFLIPDPAYRLMYVVTALALAWLLTRVFK